MIVRACELASRDEAGLAHLWVSSWSQAMPTIDFAARRPWILERLRRWPPSDAFIAIRDDRAAGFLLLDLAAGMVDQLVVSPEAKGSGLAADLLRIARASAPTDLALDVNADNLRAVRFYEREGFLREAEGINPASGLPTWRMRAPRLIPLRSA